ncbi:hypothetical protein [Paenibacillus cineris]|uniref:hypothetical protein n=1 Tax=Paenibacillus cineris TaxID=237530 RepID=UPI001BB327A5|nr:hypothetical protein [Paenibacillus cineris]
MSSFISLYAYLYILDNVSIILPTGSIVPSAPSGFVDSSRAKSKLKTFYIT